ncbi:MAG: hypothetical protein IJT44_02505 [Clostridia bacterium]|nr:hypothetical protein [Clostridia bacterium]
MQPLQLILRRAELGSVQRMIRNIKQVRAQFGQSAIRTTADMLRCMSQGFGHLDYLTFGFAQNRGENRKTFMTMQDNLSLAKRLNDPEYRHFFKNKLDFNRTFHAYLGREYLDLNGAEDAFISFCTRHPILFAKAPVSFGGQDVFRVDTRQSDDLHALYRSLMEKGCCLVEEPIVQHPQMDLLCGACVNTLRVVTVVDAQNAPKVVYTLLRVGNGESAVDNISSGGMYTMPDDDGRIVYPMFCDKTVQYYDKHPKTGFSFSGFEIPFFRESKALCLRAAAEQTHMRYIGWDVAITPDGPVLVEGNPLPGYDMCQNYRFHDDGIGMKPRFRAALGDDGI